MPVLTKAIRVARGRPRGTPGYVKALSFADLIGESTDDSARVTMDSPVKPANDKGLLQFSHRRYEFVASTVCIRVESSHAYV